MRKKYFIIVLFAFECFATLCNAQYNAEMLKKYWYYRKRLIDYFTVIGGNEGESLISDRRNNIYGWEFPQSTYPRIEFGDQTLYLGWYLGVLATEYKLLADNSQDVTQTKKELYYALHAFDRLDMCEDKKPWYKSQATLDGFFFRQDANSNFFSEHPEINKVLGNIPAGYNVGSGKPMFVNEIEWPYDQTFTDPVAENKFIEDSKIGNSPSLDQITGLFIGFSLITKLIPESESYTGEFGTINFVDKTREITDRITTYVVQNGWIYKDPDGDAVKNGGGNILPIAYGFAEASNFIRGTPLDYLAFPAYCGSYDIWQSLQAAAGVFDLCTWLSINPCETKYYNLSIILGIAVVGNSWRYWNGPNPLECPVAHLFPRTTNAAVLVLTDYFNWGSFYSLLYNVLHGGVYLFSNATTESQLSSAPCDGPFYHGSSDKPCCGWASPRRFGASPDEQANGSSMLGNYNGLDYMLLHNLYYISRLGANGKDSDGNDLPQYYNGLDANITHDFPFTFYIIHPPAPPMPLTLGNLNAPIYYDLFRSIGFSGTVHAVPGDYIQTGDVTFRAGEEITMDGEFEVEEGAEFYAYIDPFECSGTSYARTANNDSAGGGRNYDTGDNATATNVPGTLLYGMHNPPFQKNNFVPLTYEEEETVVQNNGTPAIVKPDSSVAGNNFTADAKESQNSNAPAFFLLAPNPAQGKAAILSNKPCDFEITVTDILGREIFRGVKKNDTFLLVDLTGSPQGVYFVKVVRDGEVFMQKLIIQ